MITPRRCSPDLERDVQECCYSLIIRGIRTNHPCLPAWVSPACLLKETHKSQAAGDKILPLSQDCCWKTWCFVTQEVGLPLHQSAWQPWLMQAVPRGGTSGWCRAQKSGAGWQSLKEEHAQFLLTNSPTGQVTCFKGRGWTRPQWERSEAELWSCKESDAVLIKNWDILFITGYLHSVWFWKVLH